MEFLLNAFLQLVYLIAPVLLCGAAVSACRKLFIRLLGFKAGYRLIFLTSMVGTPVHELGHAVACILFGHKITEMRLMSFDATEAELGYVKHSYNRFSLFQRIGNFFIGIAPIFSGCAVLLCGLLILPGGVGTIYDLIPISADEIVDTATMATETLRGIGGVLKAFFSLESVRSVFWWIYVVIGCLVALHIHLGSTDLEGCGSGLAVFCILIVLTNLIFYSIGIESVINRGYLVFCTYLTVFLCLALLFSMFLIAIAGITALIRKCVWRKKTNEVL